MKISPNISKALILGLIPAILMVGFLFYAPQGWAVGLSKTELTPGESFDIYGDGFGSYPTSYSYVCFGDDSHCFTSTSFSLHEGWSWTNTRITLSTPTAVPISGDVIVYAKGTKQICYEYLGYCSTYDTSEEKGRFSYKIKPIILKANPAVAAKPGETITIYGDGFGDYGGGVYFDGYAGSIVNWSYKTIDIITPKLDKTTRLITVKSQNGLETSYPFVINLGISNDFYSYLQHYFSDIKIFEAWAVQTDNRNITVAVIDDGVYINHPDLSNNIWRNNREIVGDRVDNDHNGYIDDIYGWNFVDNNSFMDVRGSHGTMVAGIIGAVINNTEGIAGIAKNVKIMPIIIADENGNFVSNETIKKAIKYAVDNGAEIINLSFGTQATIGFTTDLNDSILYAYNRGVVVVAAAGNGDIEGGIGQNLNLIPQSPVCNNSGYKIILGVGALYSAIGEKSTERTYWSNYGANCVNVSAPGWTLISTSAPKYSSLGGFYDVKSGTSFSAPIVAGVAAMVRTKYPSMKNWEIIDRLIYTSDNIDSYNPGYAGQIGGRVNAYRALTDPIIEPKLISISPSIVKVGEKIYIKIEHFNLNSSLRVVGGGVDTELPSKYMSIKDANNIEFIIPSELKKDNYNLKVRYQNRDVSVINNAFSVIEGVGSSSEIQIEPKVLGVQSSSWVDNEESLVKSIDQKLINRLKGYILLQTEEHGEAWYIDPTTAKKYYMQDGPTAYEMMRSFGLGITDKNLNKIPTEGSNAKGDTTLINKLKGKILLQVQQHGEAWYVNPKDGKRYYLKDGNEAYRIMRILSLGITNKDLRKITVGRIEDIKK